HQRKPKIQWTLEERKVANLDQRLKSLIMSMLLDDEMNSVINCLTTKSTWDDLILYHERPSDVKKSWVMDLKLCYNTFKFKEGESLTQNFIRYKALMNELDFQDSPNDEKDTRSSQEYMYDLEDEYQERDLSTKSKSLSASAPSSSLGKNKSLITESYDLDKKEVSSDYNEVTKNKALMALADEERVFVSKESAKNSEWIKVSMKKQAKLDLHTMQHVNAEILRGNHNLTNELKELTSITEAWLNSSMKVNQRISEQIPTQKKKIFEIDQLTKDTSNSRPKDLVFVKSFADNSEVSTTASARGNKSSSASKTNSAHAGKLINVKIKDNPPLAIVMKELNEQKLQIKKNKSPNFRNKNSQQYHTSQGKSSSRSRPKRKREALQAKKVKSFKASKTESSSALRSKTPTKRKPFTRFPNMFKEYLAEFGTQLKLLKTLRYGKVVPAKGTPEKSFFLLGGEATKGGSSKAPTSSKTGHSKKRKESNLSMDSNPSQPLVSTPVDTGMHKEDQQVTGGLTSLEVTSEARANPQLSSCMLAFNLNEPIYSTSFIIHSKSTSGNYASSIFTTEADLRKSIPSDFVPVAVVVRDFYKKFYNSLGSVPNYCSSIGKTWGLLSFSKGIGWEGLVTI
nr:retrovirus-related Pol polyprotein from transposon TNT 1-94 [Tanacetum cinerariifolium]